MAPGFDRIRGLGHVQKPVLVEAFAPKDRVEALRSRRRTGSGIDLVAAMQENILLESLEEHLGIKRVLADLLAMGADDDLFAPKMRVLKEQVEHHGGEEEDDLFPNVKKLLDDETLIALAQQMTATQEDSSRMARHERQSLQRRRSPPRSRCVLRDGPRRALRDGDGWRPAADEGVGAWTRELATAPRRRR
jgi:hypothetical protein